jgi:hypothetical protein
VRTAEARAHLYTVRALAFAYAAVPLTSDLAIAWTRDALRASETVNRG